MEAQEFFQSDNNSNTNNVNTAASDHFIVEDLFDFSNEDVAIEDPTFEESPPTNSNDSPPLETNPTSNFFTDNSCQNSADGPFSGELSVPYDDLAELEWVSKFAEESFSSEDLHKLQLISGLKAPNNVASKPYEESNPTVHSQVSVPAKARSKRSRVPPCNWTSRLLVLSPTTTTTTTTTTSSHSDTMAPPKKPSPRKRDPNDGGEGRKCLHCATDKTPQWRTGPLGPKTLCNACGVRYKSGRLVPEYRPAASPTFVLTKHSNSHRKVQELRRQKEMMRAQQHQLLQLQHHHSIMFEGPSNGDDYLIHQHVGPDFTHLI
ncbi:GATA transcription factor, putative [Medicago truncatula]|uniref:GATA transcription factor n=2 Tax=Medicago truncatula TaxID=3880 RepID=G7J3H0_MEDTR|nr:GATA transcription factor, putative [Medicago truncatula]